VLEAVLPGRLGPSTRKGNALLTSRETLSFGTSTLPLLYASLHFQRYQSLYGLVHLHPCIGLDLTTDVAARPDPPQGSRRQPLRSLGHANEPT
jgi:hypothetical protein